MSTIARFDRPGFLERLTDSTAFAVLFYLASIVLVPFVLMGLFTLPTLLTIASSWRWEIWVWMLLPAGGAIGYVGFFLARRSRPSAAGYRATLLCLALGIVAAATVAAALVDTTGGGAARSLAALIPAIPIVAAFGRIARLRRLRAAAEGRVLDSLPLIFLTVALGEALCAIAIGVQLASAG
jgi:hypothetical protein